MRGPNWRSSARLRTVDCGRSEWSKNVGGEGECASGAIREGEKEVARGPGQTRIRVLRARSETTRGGRD